MNIIDKIEIRYFRSLYTVRMNQIRDLNIITGKNDVGKSNVLKALNYFFNGETDFNHSTFLEDFNKQRAEDVQKESIKGKRFIQVKITFNRMDGFENSLPSKFTVVKTWQKEGLLVTTDDVEALIKRAGKKYTARNKASLTKFLNKIKYFYIPAIKDKSIFQNLLLDLRDTLYDVIVKKNTDVENSLGKLNEVISSSATKLGEEYRKVTGVATELTTSKNLDELFRALNINTKYKNYDVSLDYRGDGIRVRYLPSILDYIAKNSKLFCIWGFEEPENSLEYCLANEMAKQFINEYSKRSQIFTTTHSIAFFNIDSDKSQLYRCFNVESGKGTDIKIYTDEKKDLILDKEIGQFEIQKELQKEWENRVAQLEKKNTVLIKYNDDLKKLQKHLLLTEGKTDKDFLELAYNTLGINRDHFAILEAAKINSGEGDIALKKILNMQKDLPKPHKIIGIFDRDNNNILNDRDLGMLSKVEFSNLGNNTFAFAIPIPTSRTETDKISIEHYFTDNELLTIDTKKRRLYMAGEFSASGQLKSDNAKTCQYLARKDVKPHDKYILNGSDDQKVMDQDRKVNYSLSKNDFIQHIRDKQKGFNNFDFNNFRAIVDIIEKILN